MPFLSLGSAPEPIALLTIVLMLPSLRLEPCE
jgi:hypothetical protein